MRIYWNTSHHLCRLCSDLICSFKLGIKLAEDLVKFLADDISQHVQSAPKEKLQEGTFLANFMQQYETPINKTTVEQTEIPFVWGYSVRLFTCEAFP